jgi:hypothetical protein
MVRQCGIPVKAEPAVDTVVPVEGPYPGDAVNPLVHEICMSLPEVERGTSWGDRPTYQVRGKGFLIHRAPGRTAIDPATGAPYEDLLVVATPGEAEKQALVQDPRLPFFTVDHFNGHPAVLVQQSRLAEVDREELVEIITDAWAAKAPKKLVQEYVEDG